MKSDVAIIGLSCRFPESDSVDEFLHNMERGRDLVREISYSRIAKTTIPPRKYLPMGFIEDIDVFDYKFFNL